MIVIATFPIITLAVLFIVKRHWMDSGRTSVLFPVPIVVDHALWNLIAPEYAAHCARNCELIGKSAHPKYAV